MKLIIEINCWDDEGNEVEPTEYDFEHAYEMIQAGYVEGQIVGENYTGWWKLAKDELVKSNGNRLFR